METSLAPAVSVGQPYSAVVGDGVVGVIVAYCPVICQCGDRSIIHALSEARCRALMGAEATLALTVQVWPEAVDQPLPERVHVAGYVVPDGAAPVISQVCVSRWK